MFGYGKRKAREKRPSAKRLSAARKNRNLLVSPEKPRKRKG